MIYAYIKLSSDKGYKEAGYRIEVPSPEAYFERKQYYQEYAIIKLCHSRGWTLKDLQQYGYNKIRVFFKTAPSAL